MYAIQSRVQITDARNSEVFTRSHLERMCQGRPRIPTKDLYCGPSKFSTRLGTRTSQQTWRHPSRHARAHHLLQSIILGLGKNTVKQSQLGAPRGWVQVAFTSLDPFLEQGETSIDKPSDSLCPQVLPGIPSTGSCPIYRRYRI